MTPRLILLAMTACLALPAQAQTVVLVRHAEKADQSADPDLSTAGQARAEALAEALSGAKVTRVLVTSLKRTHQTASPIVEAAGVSVFPVSLEGGTAAHVARVAAEARQAGPNATVLIVGHSNTVPEIARALGDPAPRALSDCDYDKMTILDLSGDAPRVFHTRYGQPTTSC